MPDIWFVFGVAVGTIITGFRTIGSFDRGSDSVRRRSWSRELAARQHALVASRAAVRALGQPAAERGLHNAS